MKKSIKLIVLSLILILLAAPALSACAKEVPEPTYAERLSAYLTSLDNSSLYDEQHTKVHDKAILLLPGLMDSSLYDDADKDAGGNPKSYWGADLGGDITSALPMMGNLPILAATNADGVPTKALRAGRMTDRYPYDAFGFFKDIYEYCTDRYAANYDVICWQYDWRSHLDHAASKLNAFIETQGYEKVIIIGHSMGCCVTSRYLSMGQAQRDKVELFISYGGPMLGAIDANAMAFEAEGKIDLTMKSLTGMIESSSFSMTSATQQLACGMHLMGFDAYNSTPYFENGETYFSVDDQYKTHAEYLSYIEQNYDWTKGSDGNVKFVVDTFPEFESAVFVDGKHISRLVNTEYVCAVGQNTCYSINVNSATKKLTAAKTTDRGDMLVTLYSATAGITWEGDDVPENIHILSGYNHLSMLVTDPLDDVFDKFDNR